MSHLVNRFFPALVPACFLLPLLGLASALPRTPAAPGPGAILELHERLFQALDRGDRDAVRDCLSSEGVEGGREGTTLFVSAGESALVPVSGTEDDPLVLWAAMTGAGTTIRSVRVDCPREIGYAALEIERTWSSVAGDRRTLRFWVTSLVRWEEGRWRVFHLHVSPAPTSSTRADESGG